MAKTSLRWLASAIALVSAGAQAQIPAQAPAPPPARAVDDPPAAAPALTRVTWQQALDRALAQNPSAIIASKEIDRASALLREARAGWLPALLGNGSVVHLGTFGATLPPPHNIWNGNITLNVPLLSPVAWANDAHAQDGRAIATASAADVRRQLAAAVGRAYLTVLLQHRLADVAARARETAFAHYDYAHTRLQAGLGNGIDDARAEQELRTDEAQLKNAQTALLRAQSALAILLSEESLVDVVDDVALGTTPLSDAAVGDARSQRADVRALQARRLATQHLRRDDWVYYAPSLLAQAEVFKETVTPLQRADGWQAALVLQIPFFDGGLRYGVQRERRASDEEAEAQLGALLRQVSVEVRAAAEVVRNADASLMSARAAASAATLAAVLADKSYRAGASTNIEVIDAERQARDAGSQVVIAEDAARQARLDLLLATGAFP